MLLYCYCFDILVTEERLVNFLTGKSIKLYAKLSSSVHWHCWLHVRKNTGVDICLEQGASDSYMVQLMLLPPHRFLFH